MRWLYVQAWRWSVVKGNYTRRIDMIDRATLSAGKIRLQHLEQLEKRQYATPYPEDIHRSYIRNSSPIVVCCPASFNTPSSATSSSEPKVFHSLDLSILAAPSLHPILAASFVRPAALSSLGECWCSSEKSSSHQGLSEVSHAIIYVCVLDALQTISAPRWLSSSSRNWHWRRCRRARRRAIAVSVG